MRELVHSAFSPIAEEVLTVDLFSDFSRQGGKVSEKGSASIAIWHSSQFVKLLDGAVRHLLLAVVKRSWNGTIMVRRKVDKNKVSMV